MNEETQDAGLISSSSTAEPDIDELSCLSGDKPFFDVFLSKSHVESPYQLVLNSFSIAYYVAIHIHIQVNCGFFVIPHVKCNMLWLRYLYLIIFAV